MLIKHGDGKIINIIKGKELEEKTAAEILEESMKKDGKDIKEKKPEQIKE